LISAGMGGGLLGGSGLLGLNGNGVLGGGSNLLGLGGNNNK